MKSLAFTASAIALACVALSAPAQAALTLTINTGNQTFTWSGSATSDTFNVASGNLSEFRIATDGDSSTVGTPTSGAGSLGISSTSFGFVASLNPAPGRPTITTTPGFFTQLGSVNAFIIPESGTITVTGDNIAYSYAGPAAADFESLDGASLFFQQDLVNFGSSIGSITVIPEPSAFALLGCAGLLLLRRRR